MVEYGRQAQVLRRERGSFDYSQGRIGGDGKDLEEESYVKRHK